MTAVESLNGRHRAELGKLPVGFLEKQNILTIDQFGRSTLEQVCALAAFMKDASEKRLLPAPLERMAVCCIFFEPSSRTMESFGVAANKLGAFTRNLVGEQDKKTGEWVIPYSSMIKGETFEDTIATLSTFYDVMVIRHPVVGKVEIAAEHSMVPVINGGDGIGEHPTQGLLDLFTIYDELGEVDGKHIVLVGDPKNGRTIHSLIKILTYFDVDVTVVAPEELALQEEYRQEAKRARILREETTDFERVIPTADIIYMTRVQGERFPATPEGRAAYERVKDAYIMTPALMATAKPKMALMHPLPRKNEIDVHCDSDPRSAYKHRQMRNGLYVREALLAAVLGKV